MNGCIHKIPANDLFKKICVILFLFASIKNKAATLSPKQITDENKTAHTIINAVNYRSAGSKTGIVRQLSCPDQP